MRSTRETAIEAPAPSSATSDGSRPVTGCGHEPDQDQGEHDAEADEQLAVGDGVALLERHHRLRAVAGRSAGTVAEHQPAQPDEHGQQHHDDGGQVDEEVVERQPGRGWR